MKVILTVLSLATTFLGYRVLTLEADIKQLYTNSAIAVLSAEAANQKVGAIAPYFGQDKEAFANAWLDSLNMPQAVFPNDVLGPLKRKLEEMRATENSQRQKAEIFK